MLFRVGGQRWKRWNEQSTRSGGHVGRTWQERVETTGAPSSATMCANEYARGTVTRGFFLLRKIASITPSSQNDFHLHSQTALSLILTFDPTGSTLEEVMHTYLVCFLSKQDKDLALKNSSRD